MAATWVLKFRQVDKPDQPILIHVTRKQGSTIDLDLLATDGDEVYKGNIRQRNLSKLKSRNYEGTDSEWASLMHYALVSKRDHDVPKDLVKNLEMDCTISESAARLLTITLRSRIEDITHRLGAVELTYSEDTDEVDLFGWACRLADQRDELESQVTSNMKEVAEYITTIARLEAQLADLVTAKQEHEDQLLTKFAMLLNEKKAKIRDQQRVLQTAKVDQKKLDELQRKVRGHQKSSTSSKRKRNSNKTDDGHGSPEESDAFEAMEVDEMPENDNQSGAESGRETPPRSDTPDTQTASEDEGDLAPSKPGGSSKSKAVTSGGVSSPPPQRYLPFQRKDQKSEEVKKEKQSSPPAGTDEDEETASEDDEL